MIDEKFEKWREAGRKYQLYWLNYAVPYIRKSDGLKLCDAVWQVPMMDESLSLKFILEFANEDKKEGK